MTIHYPLEDIYSLAASKLKINLPSAEYDWLRGHIGLVDMDILERQILQCNIFVEAITENLRTGRFSDHWLHGGKITRDPEYSNFVDANVTELVHRICRRMPGDYSWPF